MQRRAVSGSGGRRAAVVVCAALSAGFGGRTREPGGTAAAAAAAEAAVREVPDAGCRAAISADLQAGERTARSDACAAFRDRASARAVAASGARRSFGIVEEEKASLSGVKLVLSAAHACSRWPLRTPGARSLAIGEALAAGCRVRRYHGPLAIAVLAADGRRETALVGHTDEDGRVEVRFFELDALLRARGRAGLLEQATLVLGADGWVGRVELQGLRAQLADWHATWVSRGRGLPGLFAALHPEHPDAQAMRVRALEATLKRQEADAKKVELGELSVRWFLERHAWSPYRSLVTRKAAGAKDRSERSGP